MPRTKTSHFTSFTRSLPSSVTYDLASSNHVLITLPAQSSWSSGVHWHNTHTEFLRVLKGTIYLLFEQEIHLIGPDAGTVVVETGVRHCWGRADSVIALSMSEQVADGRDGDVVVEERTDPVDGQKEVFFRNLNSVLLEPALPHVPSWMDGLWKELLLLLIFATLDNYPVMLDLRKWGTPSTNLDRVLEKSIAVRSGRYVEKMIGWILQIESVSKEYTPDELYTRWHSEPERG
ncbi:hypothetical protein LTR66_010298 [Elasticomyces elasticus]|nr:hypothetical protein LTR66_010298 [Elasticomyces elasticus]